MVQHLREAWKDTPPAQILLAWRYGYKPPKKPEDKVRAAEGLLLRFGIHPQQVKAKSKDVGVEDRQNANPAMAQFLKRLI